MPLFTPDFAGVEANIHVYDKSRVQLKITKRTPGIKESKDRNTGDVNINPFVRYSFELAGIYEDGKKGPKLNTEQAGKTVSPMTVWLRTEGGWKFAKPFIMAAAGLNVRRDEDKANQTLFNPETAATMWEFSGDPGATAENIRLGAGWDSLVGRHVDVNLVKKIEERDGVTYESQEFAGWTPVE
jgi:hypothetical protein